MIQHLFSKYYYCTWGSAEGLSCVICDMDTMCQSELSSCNPAISLFLRCRRYRLGWWVESTLNRNFRKKFYNFGIWSKTYFCSPCPVDISHVFWVCCVIVMDNTVFVQVLKVCNTVKPSLVFHTGGMFVILINVSIFRISENKKKMFIRFETVLRYLSKSSVLVFFG